MHGPAQPIQIESRGGGDVHELATSSSSASMSAASSVVDEADDFDDDADDTTAVVDVESASLAHHVRQQPNKRPMTSTELSIGESYISQAFDRSMRFVISREHSSVGCFDANSQRLACARAANFARESFDRLCADVAQSDCLEEATLFGESNPRSLRQHGVLRFNCCSTALDPDLSADDVARFSSAACASPRLTSLSFKGEFVARTCTYGREG